MHNDVVPLNPCDYAVEEGIVKVGAPARSNFIRKPGAIALDNAAFCCVHQEGDFSLSARVILWGDQPEDGAFLMVREHRERWVKITLRREADGGCRIVSRRTDGWSEDTLGDCLHVQSCYLRIVRRGDQFYLYYSLEPYGWKLVDSFKLSMDSRLSVGFGAQSPRGTGCQVRVEDILLSDVILTGFPERN
ncbi:DUF1349 domain-containing protein [Lewinella sp. IMCC34183]|uniref:DUF1349 domain-containing protein n=1 Tax=Lewinella sp. IMCC34183 TaxID=2248762 RepID=UPI000E26F15A|nr:DUF1349 domain-containing protein [Lewinella sp. IMCC34183]